MFRSQALPFDEVMDSSFVGIGISFEDLFDSIAVLMFEFW